MTPKRRPGRPRQKKYPPAASYVLILFAVAVHATFWLSLRYGFLDPLFNDSTHRLPRGVDFYAVYQKSHEFSIGRSLYTDVDYTPAGREHLVVPYCAPHYRYLPSWGAFMSLSFCLLAAQDAYWLWVVSCEIMLLVCLWRFLLKTNDLRIRAALVVIWLCFTPYYLELFVGQFTFMTTGLITFSLLAFESKHNWRGTLWLALSVGLKYIGIILLAPLALLGRWRNVLVVLAAAVVVSLIYFIPNPEDFRLFAGVAFYGTPNPFHAGNLGLQGFLGNVVRLIPFEDSVLAAGLRVLFLKLIPLGFVIGLLWITWRYGSEANLIPICLLWLTGYFLAGTDVFEHHYVLLLPVFAFAWLRRPGPLLLVLYAWIALPTIFYWVDIPGLPHQRFAEVENLWWNERAYGRIFLYHLWKVVPTLWLFVWLFGLVDKAAVAGRGNLLEMWRRRFRPVSA